MNIAYIESRRVLSLQKLENARTNAVDKNAIQVNPSVETSTSTNIAFLTGVSRMNRPKGV